MTLNVGDEVIYTADSIWKDTVGVVLSVLSDSLIEVRVTKPSTEIHPAWKDSVSVFSDSNWELMYLQYDPSQQEDSENDI